MRGAGPSPVRAAVSDFVVLLQQNKIEYGGATRRQMTNRAAPASVRLAFSRLGGHEKDFIRKSCDCVFQSDLMTGLRVTEFADFRKSRDSIFQPDLMAGFLVTEFADFCKSRDSVF